MCLKSNLIWNLCWETCLKLFRVQCFIFYFLAILGFAIVGTMWATHRTHWLEHNPGRRPNIMSQSIMSTDTEREAIVYACVLSWDYPLCHSPDHGTYTDERGNTQSWNESVLAQHSFSSVQHSVFFLLSVSVSLQLPVSHIYSHFHFHYHSFFLVNLQTPTDLIHLEFCFHLNETMNHKY